MTAETSPDALAREVLCDALHGDGFTNAVALIEAGHDPSVSMSTVIRAMLAYASRVSTPAGEVELPCDRHGETALDRIRDYAENGTMASQLREDLRTLVALSAPTPNAGEREIPAEDAYALRGRIDRVTTANLPRVGTYMTLTRRALAQVEIADGINALLATPPQDAAERMREAAAKVCEDEAAEYRAAQDAATDDCDKLYRMGQKDGLLLAANAIRALLLPSPAVPADVEGLRDTLSRIKDKCLECDAGDLSGDEAVEEIARILAARYHG